MDEFLKRGTEKDVERRTGLRNVIVLLGEVYGSQYLFQSGDALYFYNAVTDDCEKVEEPKDYDELIKRMNNDFSGVRVETLDQE